MISFADRPLFRTAVLLLGLALAATRCGRKNPSGPNGGGGTREYFVAPGGDDSGPGTAEQPWATLDRGASALGPGVTVTVRAGTYRITNFVRVSAQARSDAWAELRGAAGERAVIDASGANIAWGSVYPYTRGAVEIQNAAFVRVRNLEVWNSHLGGINVDKSRHVDVVNCLVRNTLCPGIAAWQGCSGIRILGNTVVNANDVRQSWDPYTGSEAPHEAVSLAGPDGFEVAYNLVQYCKKEGIDVKETSRNGNVHHNRVSHCDRQGLYIDGWFGALERVEMHHNVVNACEAGIAVSSEDGPATRDLSIHHNLVYDNRATGLFFSRWGKDNPRANVRIWNNTFYRNGYGGTAAGDPNYWLTGGLYFYSTNLADVRVENNVFSRNKPFEIGRSEDYGEGGFSAKGITVRYNLVHDVNTVSYPFHMAVWAQDWVWPVAGDSSASGDPLFLDAAGADFRPGPGSPAVDAGDPRAEFLDADGSRCDAGALPLGASDADLWWKSGFPPRIDPP